MIATATDGEREPSIQMPGSHLDLAGDAGGQQGETATAATTPMPTPITVATMAGMELATRALERVIPRARTASFVERSKPRPAG